MERIYAESPLRLSLLFAHDLFGKPVPTFPDHALPRAEGGGAEQLPLLGGWSTPIWRRRGDVTSKFSGGVPAPARVVKHAARQRDHVGLARGNDFFGMAGLCDQADRGGADAGRLPDRLRERHLVARRERYFLRRRHAAGGAIDPIDGALLQFPG